MEQTTSSLVAIVKETVVEHVMIKAAYIGAKCADFSRVSILEADRALIDKLWLEARAEAVVTLSSLGCAWNDEPCADIAVTLPETEAAMAPALSQALHLWMQARILWKWLMLIGWHPVDANGKAIASSLFESADPAALFKDFLDSRTFLPVRRRLPPF